MSMFKWIFGIALFLSVLACGAYDFLAERRLTKLRAEIAQKRAELTALHDLDQEVSTYQKKKAALQMRIDLINQQKQNQKGAADAVAKLAALGAEAGNVESAAVIDGGGLVINTPSGSRTLR